MKERLLYGSVIHIPSRENGVFDRKDGRSSARKESYEGGLESNHVSPSSELTAKQWESRQECSEGEPIECRVDTNHDRLHVLHGLYTPHRHLFRVLPVGIVRRS